MKTMTEYITKGQAVDAAYRAIHYGFNDVHKAMMEGKDLKVDADNFYYTLLENVRAEIAVAPVADVAPVVHAENVANAHPSEEFKCSKCGTYLVDYIELRKVDGVDDFYIYEFTDWNFCPKCGARMEGE